MKSSSILKSYVLKKVQSFLFRLTFNLHFIHSGIGKFIYRFRSHRCHLTTFSNAIGCLHEKSNSFVFSSSICSIFLRPSRSFLVSVPRRNTKNSSPPIRTTVPISKKASCKMSANDVSNRSPLAWPYVSLVFFNPFKSILIIAYSKPSLSAIVNNSSHLARLYKPVSASRSPGYHPES